MSVSRTGSSHAHPPGTDRVDVLLEGFFGLQCGTEKTVLQTGDSFMTRPKGLPHAYVVLVDKPAEHL
jgi:hypothetical protein